MPSKIKQTHATTADPVKSLPPFLVTRPISAEDVSSLLYSAFESGGVNYWLKRCDLSRHPTVKVPSAVAPLFGGSLLLHLIEDVDDYRPDVEPNAPARTAKDRRLLDGDALRAGLQLLSESEDYRHHFADIINDRTDATTGDVFVQFCVFGTVVFS